MEQARLFLAIGLSILVFITWNYFFAPPPAPLNETLPAQETTAQAPDDGAGEKMASPPDAALPDVAVSATDTPVRQIRVDTKLYQATLTERGALVKQLALKAYRESAGADAPYKTLISKSVAGNCGVSFGDIATDTRRFTATTDGDTLVVDDASQTLSFVWAGTDGLTVEKTFTFYPDTYRIDYAVTLFNQGRASVNGPVSVGLTHDFSETQDRISFSGPAALIGREVETVKLKKIKKQSRYPGEIHWIALEDRYFMSALVPDSPVTASMQLAEVDGVVDARLEQAAPVLPPGTHQTFSYHLYMGPKQVNVLESVGFELKKAVDFGFFDMVAKIFLWLLNLCHDRVIANYGVCIILLTLGIKIVLWPLGTKSYTAMSEMKKLQPLMADIREKYKNDKQKMNEEVMRLYRTYKVNPMSGCLPMLVQLPIFLAFYRVLYEAIELRHAPFAGWITDLSAPDRLFHFGFSIPMMAEPYGIPVLTIVMGATMFLQQKMSPPAGDPTQAKMMMFLPLIFTVIFINFPAGLVLYWLVNNILSIGQQTYIMKKLA
ncbi:MAG: membrane protein insertase YidC [Deltaproteobacteria bacterium]|nr:MAG: membrane protein insertase YidC [Deltaproteobacteria bacterium]